MSIISGDKAEGTSEEEEEGQEVGSESDEVVLIWYTVWYCVLGESTMMFWDGKDWRFTSLAEAKAETLKGFSGHWWISERPGGWLEIRDQDFNLVYSTKKELQQLRMF